MKITKEQQEILDIKKVEVFKRFVLTVTAYKLINDFFEAHCEKRLDYLMMADSNDIAREINETIGFLDKFKDKLRKKQHENI
jgi:hypothetical protein